MADRLHLTIGEVLSLLREEFPDVSISKIRFLESQGLVDPERTPSGYRKFYDQDVERLRWILRQQREHFLPLKVIRGRLTGQEGDADPTDAGAPAAVPAVSVPSGSGASSPAGASSPSGASSLAGASSASGAVSRARSTAGSGATHAPDAAPGPVAPPEAGTVHEAGGNGAAPASGPAPGTGADPTRGADPSGGADPATGAGPTRRAASHTGTAPGAAGGGPDGPGDVSAATAPTRAEPAPSRSRRGSAGGEAPAQPDVYTVSELAEAVGCTSQLIRDLQQYGILVAGASVGGTPYFDPDAVGVARIGARFAELGVEPRHLRTWRNAADREASLFEQLVMPLLRQRNPQSRRQAADRLDELATLGAELRAGLIAEAVRSIR